LALRELRAGRPQKTDGAGLQIADIGTGSGCIAVSLAKELPAANIVATDISSAALAVAKRNAQRHAVADRIRFIECNLLDAWRSPISLVVSNPPYVGRREAASLPVEVREHEPASALYGGQEGYELYGPLVTEAANLLTPGGILVLELGHNSLPAVQPLLDTATWANIGITNDLAGIPRVLAAERVSAKIS